jgi:hypothetical protein
MERLETAAAAFSRFEAAAQLQVHRGIFQIPDEDTQPLANVGYVERNFMTQGYWIVTVLWY